MLLLTCITAFCILQIVVKASLVLATDADTRSLLADQMCSLPSLSDSLLATIRRASRREGGVPTTTTDVYSSPNVQRIQRVFTEAQFNFLFPRANMGKGPAIGNGPYTYQNFLKAAAMWPDFCNSASDTSANLDTVCKREIASMVAHFAQEVGEHDESNLVIPTWRQGLYFFTEFGCSEDASVGGCEYRGGTCDASSWAGSAWPCPSGVKYFGRGAKQLSYNFNYGPFSYAIFGDVNVLLKNPSLVVANDATNGWLSFASAFWFYMTPQSPKPSMHDVVTGYWVPNAADISAGRTTGFGVLIMIINGGVECGGSTDIQQAANRINYYTHLLEYFGLPAETDKSKSCARMMSFDTSSSAYVPSYWERSWSSTSCNGCVLQNSQTAFSVFDDPSALEVPYKKCVINYFGNGQPSLVPTTSPAGPQSGAPTFKATAAPTAVLSCSDCSACVSIPGNYQAATDSQCAPCAGGKQPWWPCTVVGACQCANSQSKPSANPTVVPSTQSSTPSQAPSTSQTSIKTIAPSLKPTVLPTALPTRVPTKTIAPSSKPTVFPTRVPTKTIAPSLKPTVRPTALPTRVPTKTIAPTLKPTTLPTAQTQAPTKTVPPTFKPTVLPTALPSQAPTKTVAPTLKPAPPTVLPSKAPSQSIAPTVASLSPTQASAPIQSAVPGWPNNKIAQGGVINGGSEVSLLKQRVVDAVFTYAGIGGDGDPGRIITWDSKIDTIMANVRSIESAAKRFIMLVVVFYNINGSGGTAPLLADLSNDGPDFYLQKHIINYLSMLRQLQGYKDLSHPTPATLLLSPDFLGELHKQCQRYNCPVSYSQSVPLQSALLAAFNYLNLDVSVIPSEFLVPDTQIKDYIRCINWMTHTFAPSVPFGWQTNVWAGDEMGHGWIHAATRNDPSLVDQHIQSESDFLRTMNVMGNTNADYNPHFLAFDKWERDVFDASLGGAGVNNGYLYNAEDLHVYLKYTKGVSANFNNIPLMLWQIPGGHLQSNSDIDTRLNHASTEPDYILGNPAMDDTLSTIAPYIIKTGSIGSVYKSTATSVAQYLSCPSTMPNCWKTGHLQDVKDANVFAILWGGGSTTSIAGLSSDLDDHGWLYQRIYDLGLQNQVVFNPTTSSPSASPTGLYPSPTVNPTSRSVPTWSATTIYDQPNTLVLYKGVLYKNMWYTVGDEPDKSGEWGVWRVVVN